MIKIQTLKGFRDFLPKEARKRQYVIDKIRGVFESYGFEPLETPALEYEEILLGKYGDEGDKLMYRFEDNGKRKVALRYDQTVPLARVIAQYQNELPMPFKRYQMQNVWRADNTQKGRYREFLQCDVDIVGSSSPLADAETIGLAVTALKTLGFSNYKIWVNDRNILFGLTLRVPIAKKKIVRVMEALDEFKKIGKDAVISKIEKAGFTKDEALYLFEQTEFAEETPWLKQVMNSLKKVGIEKDNIEFSPILARGLSYYTSTIFEIEIEGYNAGSIAGGGRYDNLIGIFAEKQIPAVGFSFGFDRLIEAMDELNLFPTDLETTKVLITENDNKSLEIANQLRSRGINTEIWLDTETDLGKKVKYAQKKQIPFIIKFNTEGEIILGDMKTNKQKTTSLGELAANLK